MTTTVQEVFEEALELSEDSRVVLAERLLASVTPAPQVLAEQMKVVRQRIADLDTGRVQPIPGPEVLRRVRNRNR